MRKPVSTQRQAWQHSCQATAGTRIGADRLRGARTRAFMATVAMNEAMAMDAKHHTTQTGPDAHDESVMVQRFKPDDVKRLADKPCWRVPAGVPAPRPRSLPARCSPGRDSKSIALEVHFRIRGGSPPWRHHQHIFCALRATPRERQSARRPLRKGCDKRVQTSDSHKANVPGVPGLRSSSSLIVVFRKVCTWLLLR